MTYAGNSGTSKAYAEKPISKPVVSPANKGTYGFGGLEKISGNSSIYSFGSPSMMGGYQPTGNLIVDYINLLKLVKEYEFMIQASQTMGAYGMNPRSMGKNLDVYNKGLMNFAGYAKPDKNYESKKTKQTVQKSEANLKIFNPNSFVSRKTKFVKNTDEIMNYVKEAFKLTAGYDLPENITINLCSEKELKRAHDIFKGEWSDGIQGFCVNRLHENSQVFVKKDELAKTMLTIGHELGHLQTSSLDPVEEEAKAYAFSIEWMNQIKQNDIANLGNIIITDNPSNNGLHNVAFDFVSNLIKQGMSALDVFNSLIENNLKICS